VNHLLKEKDARWKKKCTYPAWKENLRNSGVEYLSFEPGAGVLIQLVVFQSILHGFLPIDNREVAKTIEMSIANDEKSDQTHVEIYCLRFDPVLSAAARVRNAFWLQADESEEDPHSNPNIAIGDARS
jgi:hypothetical protein